MNPIDLMKLLLAISTMFNVVLFAIVMKRDLKNESSEDEYECSSCGADVEPEEIYGHSCPNCRTSRNNRWWRRIRLASEKTFPERSSSQLPEINNTRGDNTFLHHRIYRFDMFVFPKPMSVVHSWHRLSP